MPGPPLQVITAASDSAASLPGWAQQATAWIPLAGAATGVLALLVALAAAIVGSQQLREARRSRREQAQAYVVIYAQPLHFSPHLVELVVENTGATAARDVVITADPPLDRTAGPEGTKLVQLPETMSVLAPRQQWRTFWDSSIARHDRAMVDRFEVTVTYMDTFKENHEEVYVLDWRLLYGRRFIKEKGLHHIAASLEDLTGVMKNRLRPGRVFKVATYDGVARDERLAAEEAEEEAALEAAWLRDHPEDTGQAASSSPAAQAKKTLRRVDTTVRHLLGRVGRRR